MANPIFNKLHGDSNNEMIPAGAGVILERQAEQTVVFDATAPADVTLPASPEEGDTVKFTLKERLNIGLSLDNMVEIKRPAAEKILGEDDDVFIDRSFDDFELAFDGTDWV